MEPIAIIGQGCVLPGCFSPEDLWNTVAQGRVNLTEVAEGEWPAVNFPDNTPWQQVLGTRQGGYIRGFETHFHPEAYGVPPELAASLDPLFQWSLYAVRQALTSAGEHNQKYLSHTGLYLGNLSYPSVAFRRYFEETYREAFFPNPSPTASKIHPLNRFMSGGPALLIRQAFHLGLEAVALDAACASSLYALKFACDRLQSGRAKMMLAAGINGVESFFLHAGFVSVHAISTSGQSRPFHEAADGLVPANGAACVVLKRLDDALKDQDNILGVIKGIGLCNDGRSAGFLQPASAGQVRCMQAAFSQAEVSPGAIAYVECHATGTASGDQTEIQSMQRVFGADMPLTIGSLKANVGHLVTASGLAGLIKVLEAMAREALPATPNAFPLMPVLKTSNFQVLEKPKPWPSGPKSRLACVSNFGFGGNNAHVIVEHYDKSKASSRRSQSTPASKRVAVVGLAMRGRQFRNTSDFLDLLLTGTPPAGDDMETISMSPKELVFPPKDLEQALGQQLLLLELTRLALQPVVHLDGEATGVYIGMGIDAEINRFALKWRLKILLEEWGSAVGKQDDDIGSELTAAGLLGTMPNIPANRLNHQYDLSGPGLTVSCEELSGDHALALATRAIRKGELRAAVVGAVDFSRERVHDRAAQALGLLTSDQESMDAGVVMILKNKEDALADGDAILATLEEHASGSPFLTLENSQKKSPVQKILGYSHAASGLLDVAAGLVLARQRRHPAPDQRPGGPEQALARTADVVIKNQSFLGSSVTTVVRHEMTPLPQLAGMRTLPKVFTYAAADYRGLVKALEENKIGHDGPCRVAFFAVNEDQEPLRQKILQRLHQGQPAEGWQPEGFAFGSSPVSGEMAFVYTGAAAAYPQVGRGLWEAYPQLAGSLGNKLRQPEKTGRWIAAAWADDFQQPFYQLIGTTVMAQLHTQWSKNVLGLKPQAAIGLSAGETNALLAFELWQDMDLLLQDVEQSTAYTRALGGTFEAVARFWQWPAQQPVHWENWRLLVNRTLVEEALRQQPLVYLTIVYTDQDCMIGGEAQACRQVVEALGKDRAVLVDNQFAIHCPPVQAFSQAWRDLHTRPLNQVQGVRIYSAYFGRAYTPTPGRIAEALTGQAVGTIDFPKLIRQAWEDGIRIFVEHGPRNTLASSIAYILKGKPHLALSWDKTGQDALHQLHRTSCELWCAGVDFSWPQALLGRTVDQTNGQSRQIAFKLHKPTITLRCAPSVEPEVRIKRLLPAPVLAGVMEQEIMGPKEQTISEPLPAKTVMTGHDRNVSREQSVRHWHDQLLQAHQAYMARQAEGFQATLQVLEKLWAPVAGTAPVGLEPNPLANKDRPQSSLISVEPPTTDRQQVDSVQAMTAQETSPKTPLYDRQALLIHSSGNLAEIFGPLFEKQSAYAVQIRLPEPPLLLVDRIIALEGEAGSQSKGAIWTEAEVQTDSWYLHHGRMPAGLFVESGQADLFLISWLGADFINQGERAYRLLGCELTYYGELPKPGDVLRYHITITGYARQGAVRLFFFENDCWINGERRLSVRHGQAGFFTAEELEASGGALWDPAQAPYDPQAKLELSERHTSKRAFSNQEVQAYTEGDMVACFGEALLGTVPHTRTPRSQAGSMNFIGAVTTLDLVGGPAKRGYLRAESPLDPEAWYFKCHFKNDPCMPGTLMAEAGLQMMSFYMTAAGLTISRDGWRFEPASGETFKFICRGQVTPSSKQMTYELFVEELIAGPLPILRAHMLCTVDGVKAFLCEHMTLRLVPDWPLTSMPELLEEAQDQQQRPCAEFEGFVFDHAALLHSALGRPSLAFGPHYEAYDHEVRPMRLPGPPFHFMTRVVDLQARFGSTQDQPTVWCEYDIPRAAWYLQENPSGIMTFSMLMEIGLQPCGWLAAFTNPPEIMGRELYIRNLDGTATVKQALTIGGQTIRTKTVLKASFRTSEIMINKYAVEAYMGQTLVMHMDTVFGLFPPQAMAQQKGFPVTDEEDAWQALAPKTVRHLNPEQSPEFFKRQAALPKGKLLMIDRIVLDDPQGGDHGLGLLIAEKDVDPGEWFFKAHFYQDPVQPGSLGLEAMVQVLHYYMLSRHQHQDMVNPVLEPIMLDQETEWHYRGQVTPSNRCVRVTITITQTGRDEVGPWVQAKATLWADQLKIFSVPKMSMRLRSQLK